MNVTSNLGVGGDARDSKRRNGIQKIIKSRWQSEPLQGDKHPTKPIELASITEKDNGRMDAYNRV